MHIWATDDGLGTNAIARRLNELGVPPPSAVNGFERRSNWGWHSTSVYEILTNRRYICIQRHRYGRNAVAHEGALALPQRRGRA